MFGSYVFLVAQQVIWEVMGRGLVVRRSRPCTSILESARVSTFYRHRMAMGLVPISIPLQWSRCHSAWFVTESAIDIDSRTLFNLHTHIHRQWNNESSKKSSLTLEFVLLPFLLILAARFRLIFLPLERKHLVYARNSYCILKGHFA